MNCTYNKEVNLSKYLYYMKKAASEGADLIVFPEQSLQGYLTDVAAMNMTGSEENDFRYQYENAETLPDGPSIKKIEEAAAEYGLYTVFGMTERDQELDYKLYNTAVLIGPQGYIGSYRKVHQPDDECHIYYSGTEFKVFHTGIGNIGLLICYDKWFPESTRELAVQGADLLIMPTATCFSEPEKEDFSTDYAYYTFDMMDKIRALENQTFFISSNQVGLCGKSLYFGNSSIVTPKGYIGATTGYQEGICFYETDLHREIYEAKYAFAGMSFLKDRRPSAYNHISETSGTCNNI